MLDALVDCIEMLKTRIARHKETLGENEIRTRTALVDPLLSVLGWDLSDPDLVIPEYNVKPKGRADYALLMEDGKPVAMIEAKKLGASLPQHRNQMLTYANSEGIPYTGLTDGDHWELYDVFKPVPLNEKQLLDISISDNATHKNALKLLLLWRPNLGSGEAASANDPVYVDPSLDPSNGSRAAEVKPLKDAPVGSSSVEAKPIQDPPNGDYPPPDPTWKALSDYDPPKGTLAPSTIRFWDNTEHAVDAWIKVLVRIVEKLYNESVLRTEHAPIQWSPKTYGIHTKPVHPTGNKFATYEEIQDSGLFLNKNLSASQMLKNTKKLLEHYKINPAKVFLKVS